MIYTIYDLLEKNELSTMLNMCDNFEIYDVDRPEGNESKNSYNRVFVYDHKLENYYLNLISFLENNINKDKFDIN